MKDLRDLIEFKAAERAQTNIPKYANDPFHVGLELGFMDGAEWMRNHLNDSLKEIGKAIKICSESTK